MVSEQTFISSILLNVSRFFYGPECGLFCWMLHVSLRRMWIHLSKSTDIMIQSWRMVLLSLTMSSLIFCLLNLFMSVLSEINILSYWCFLSASMVYSPRSIYLYPVCVFIFKVGFLYTKYSWFLFFDPVWQSVSFNWYM